MPAIEQILLEAIEEKRQCIRQIQDLLDSGIISPEIVTAFRKIRSLQNDILQLQGFRGYQNGGAQVSYSQIGFKIKKVFGGE
jgi:hypothetical protein